MAALITAPEDVYHSAPTGNVFDTMVSRKEFTSVVTTNDLLQPPKGFFFPYQEQQTRYQLLQPRLLCIDGPGVGKTYKAIETGLMLIGLYNPTFPRDSFNSKLPPAVRQYLEPMMADIKRVIFLTINKTLDNQAMFALNLSLNHAKLSKEVFEFNTYGAFLGSILKTLNLKDATQEAIFNTLRKKFKQDYSNTYLVLDEVHKLVGENIKPLESMDINSNYVLMNLLIKSIDHSVVTLFTATPITNNIVELIPVINLLLDENEDVLLERFKIKSQSKVEGNEIKLTTKLDKLSDEELTSLLHDKLYAKVNYVPSLPSGYNIIYVGTGNLPGTPFKYYPCELQGYQLQQYIDVLTKKVNVSTNMRSKAIEDEEDDSAKTQDALFSTEISIGLCYAPLIPTHRGIGKGAVSEIYKPDEIYYGKNSEYVQTIQRGVENRIRSANPSTTRKVETIRELENVPYVFDEEKMAKLGLPKEMWLIDTNLKELSAKYYTALKILRDDPKKLTIAFFRTIVSSGMAAFVAIAQLNGYERYDETLQDPVRGDYIDLVPKLRLVVLTPDMKPATIDLYMKIISHPDNWDGRYINLVCLTPGMRVGISIFNAQRFFSMGADWNPWTFLQASYRGAREGGMDAVMKNLGTNIVNYEIYAFCITFPRNVKLPPSNRKFLGDKAPAYPTTLDQDMYQIIRLRYISHIRPITILQNMSVTGVLNTTRGAKYNQEPVISNYTTNTFNVVYSRKYVHALKTYITQLVINADKGIRLGTIISKTAEYNIPIKFYYAAIAELVEEHALLYNSLGAPVYLAWDGEEIYQQVTYPTRNNSNSLLSYYSNFLPITFSEQQQTIPSIATTDIQTIQTLSDEQLRDYIMDNLDTPQQVLLIETALEAVFSSASYSNREDFLRRSGKWYNVLQIYDIYWNYWPHPFASPGIRLAHSFVSFVNEAGYPIVPRLKTPNRYRYYTNTWHITEDRSELVNDLYESYTKKFVAALISNYVAPYGYETLCDGIIRIVANDSTDPQQTRGRNIEAMSYIELCDIFIKVYTTLGQWKSYYAEHFKDYELRYHPSYGESALTKVQQFYSGNKDLVLEIANKFSDQEATRENIKDSIIVVLVENNRIIYA